MNPLSLGELTLRLSFEAPQQPEPDPCSMEEEGAVEATEYFQEPLAIGSPSSEQRKAYARACKRRKRLGQAMNELLLPRTFAPQLPPGIFTPVQPTTASTVPGP